VEVSPFIWSRRTLFFMFMILTLFNRAFYHLDACVSFHERSPQWGLAGGRGSGCGSRCGSECGRCDGEGGYAAWPISAHLPREVIDIDPAPISSLALLPARRERELI
jgi:hypothetical protein